MLSQEAYGDSNLFLRVDASEPRAHPRLGAALLASVRDQRADAHAAALIGVPVHVRVGASDTTVSPYYSRRMVRLLREAGAGSAPAVEGPGGREISPPPRDLPALEEVPGKAHWFW